MKKIPMRLCVACRTGRPKRELLRIVRTTEGTVVVDRSGRLNGRGAYICPNIDCFEKAIKTKAIDRALEVHLDEETIQKMRGEFTV